MPTLRELTEYHKPATLDEAVKLLRRRKLRTVPLAGGGSLIPSASPNVQAVVDLSGLGLAYVKTSEVSAPLRGENLRGLEIGAMTTLQTLIDHAAIQAYANGVVVKALLDTAARNMRETATLGGSIISAQGNSPLAAVLLALDASVTLRGRQETQAPLAEFSQADDTLITAITLPALPANMFAAYEKVARTPADLPIVCVAARYSRVDAELQDVRLALGGVGPEMMLIEADLPSLEDAVEIATTALDPVSDHIASGDYRREMIGVLVRRVLSQS